MAKHNFKKDQYKVKIDKKLFNLIKVNVPEKIDLDLGNMDKKNS